MLCLTQGLLSFRNLHITSKGRQAASAAAAAAEATVVEWTPLTTEAGRRAIGVWLLGSGGVIFRHCHVMIPPEPHLSHGSV